MKYLLPFSLLFIAYSINAQTWNTIGPEGGFFKDFIVHPTNTDIVYAGSDDGGGVWKSIDGGDSWTLLTGDYPNFTGWHIEMDEAHPDTLYFCEMYGRYGILKTTDGGATLMHQTDGFELRRDFQTSQLTIYPGAGDTIFASTGEAEDEYGRVGNGVFSSFNGGTTWAYAGLQNTAIPCINVSDSGRLLAGTAHDGLYYSDDLGATWQLHPDIPDTAGILQMDKMNGLIAVSAGANGVYLSEDNGASFNYIGVYGEFNFDLVILNTSPHLEIISTGFFKPNRYNSETGLWTPVTEPLLENHLLIGIDAIDGHIYAGIFSSTEIIRSTDNGASWYELEKNPVATEIRAIAAETGSNRLYATLQNSYNFSGDLYNTEALAISTDGGNSWERTGPLGHGLDLQIHPEDPSIVYMGTFAQGLFKSTDGFATWTNIRSGNKLVMGLEIDPQAPNELLISELDIATSEFGIYKSDDGGLTWDNAAAFVATDIAYTGKNDTVYFSHETGIYLSDDKAESIDLIPDYLAGQEVLALYYHSPYLYAGTKEGAFYRIHDNGTVDEITGGWNTEEPTPIRNIIYAGNSLIVGLSGAEEDTLHNLNGGVWQSLNQGDSWTDLTDGLTNNNVFGNTGLATSQDGQLLVATYGQGVFKSSGIVLSTNEFNENLGVGIYPNPVATELVIDLSKQAINRLKIVNAAGQIVYQNSVLNTTQFAMDLSAYPNGNYWLIIETATEQLSQPFVVQH